MLDRSRPVLRLRLAVLGAVMVIVAGVACGYSVAPGGRFGADQSDELEGALSGSRALDSVHGEERRRLVDAAEALIDHRPKPTDPLQVSATDGPFVVDAQAAWTLALAGHVTGDLRFGRSSAAIVEAWMTTARSSTGTCAEHGGCDTSLMVSRAGPGLIFAVDLLVGDEQFSQASQLTFRRWIRTVLLPAVSDRDNNWGDAGTYLTAVIGAELGDTALMERATKRWLQRLDLIDPDGTIPEEYRRGCAGLMYSQDALDYKVATADVLARAGIDLWDRRGSRGGTIERALEKVAQGMDDPSGWSCDPAKLRIPDPSGVWAIAADRWTSEEFVRWARASASGDGIGHSAVIWTLVTHPLESAGG